MRFGNYGGRLTLIDSEGRGTDVNRASDGKLPSSVPEAFERWAEVVDWAKDQGDGDIEIGDGELLAPSPAARQVLGVGINFATHAEEAGFDIPEVPMIFPKTAASLAGPYEEIEISTEAVDWEVELAVVLGKLARNVKAADAWDYIAGLTVAQDISDRGIQFRPAVTPQFSLGKSLPKFGPIGPVLVTLDEIDDPEELELTCLVNGKEVQRGNTNDFIFSIPEVIEYLSWATILYPGDVIMTGTPSGIGATRQPPVFLKAGDVVESHIAGIGGMRHVFVAPDPAFKEPAMTQGAA